MQLAVFDEQLRYLLILPAAGIAVQRAFVIVMQFIIEGGAAIEPVLFLGAVLPVLLPKEELDRKSVV